MIRQLPRLLPFLLSLCLLLGWGVPARSQTRAQHACPAEFPVVATSSAVERAQELTRLQSLAASCLQRAGYYAYLGQLLLGQERYVEALAALERSLLLDSSQLGVQLDYVLALAKTGDYDSARALAQQVLERNDAPVAVRDVLERIAHEQRPVPLDQANWQWRASVQSMLGRDSNLNSATSADAINLTLPNGNVSLLLDASSKPRSGLASLSAGHVMGQSSVEGGTLVFQGDWRERLAPGNSEFGYSQQDASLQFRPHNPQGWSQRVAVSGFSMGGTSLFAGLAGATWREYPARGFLAALPLCVVRTGVEAEHRGYAQDRAQNGVYASVFGTMLCESGDDHYQLGLQAGRDWASSSARAGGDQTRMDVKASWSRQWGWARTTADWVVSSLKDEKPYSELLGGETRSTLRQNLRVSVIKRLNSEVNLNAWGGLYSVSVVEILRHNSNLGLFDVSGRSIYTGLRYEF